MHYIKQQKCKKKQQKYITLNPNTLPLHYNNQSTDQLTPQFTMKLYQLTSTQLPFYLDITMLILILLASICLFIEDSQYKFFIILIMFIYLFYFLLYRLDKYTNKRRPLVLHQIDEDGRKIGDGSQDRSIFFREFEKRNMDRSRAGRGVEDKDNSFTNYLNRSRRAQQSRSSISNKPTSTNQFNFLSTRQPLLSQNLQNKTSSLNNSYIKHMLSHEVQTKNISEQKIKHLTEYTNKYVKTLQKYKISNQTANKCTHYTQMFCLELVRDFYQYNVNNIIDIVQYVESNYDVGVVGAYQFANLRGDRVKGQGIMQIQLDKLLDKLLSSKNFQPDLPKKTNFRISPQKPSQFFSPRQPNTLQQIPPSLSTLCKTQQYLMNQFTTPKIKNLSGQGLLQNLQILRTYIENEQNEEKQYEYLPGSKLSEDQSQRLLLAFNVCRNKINQIVGECKYWLNWELQGYFGWIRKQNGRFVVKTRLGDYGHPYLYIEDEGNGQEEIYTEPGRNNIYSTLMLYLWNLQHKQIGYIRQNQRLSQIITKYLSVLIL